MSIQVLQVACAMKSAGTFVRLIANFTSEEIAELEDLRGIRVDAAARSQTQFERFLISG